MTSICRSWTRLLALLVCAAAVAAAALPGTAVAAAAGPDYSSSGTCQFDTINIGSVRMPSATGCTGKGCVVRVTVTAPLARSAKTTSTCLGGPAPLVFFFNGFMASASSYKPYAIRLASWGYAVVQYDLAPLTIVPDAIEVSAERCSQGIGTAVDTALIMHDNSEYLFLSISLL